jgi:predicted phage-related endonuclease
MPSAPQQIFFKGEVIEMSTNELASRVKELKELQRMAEDVAAEIEVIKDELKREMEYRNSDEIITSEYKVRYSTVASHRFNTTAFKRDNSNLYEKYLTESITKRFSIA